MILKLFLFIAAAFAQVSYPDNCMVDRAGISVNEELMALVGIWNGMTGTGVVLNLGTQSSPKYFVLTANHLVKDIAREPNINPMQVFPPGVDNLNSWAPSNLGISVERLIWDESSDLALLNLPIENFDSKAWGTKFWERSSFTLRGSDIVLNSSSDVDLSAYTYNLVDTTSTRIADLSVVGVPQVNWGCQGSDSLNERTRFPGIAQGPKLLEFDAQNNFIQLRINLSYGYSGNYVFGQKSKGIHLLGIIIESYVPFRRTIAASQKAVVDLIEEFKSGKRGSVFEMTVANSEAEMNQIRELVKVGRPPTIIKPGRGHQPEVDQEYAMSNENGKIYGFAGVNPNDKQIVLPPSATSLRTLENVPGIRYVRRLTEAKHIQALMDHRLNLTEGAKLTGEGCFTVFNATVAATITKRQNDYDINIRVLKKACNEVNTLTALRFLAFDAWEPWITDGYEFNFTIASTFWQNKDKTFSPIFYVNGYVIDLTELFYSRRFGENDEVYPARIYVAEQSAYINRPGLQQAFIDLKR